MPSNFNRKTKSTKEYQMTKHKDYNNESQDARRHDQFNEVHPTEKNKNHEKLKQQSDKQNDKRK